MSESANQATPSEQTGSTVATNQMHQQWSSQAAQRLPISLAFAAILVFLVGSFHLVFSLVEFSNASWVSDTTYGTFGGRLWLWAILDLIFAGLAYFSGWDLLRGGSFGRFFALGLALVSAVRWFFYIPAQPWMALVVVALDVFIIYALVANADYFERASV